MVNSGHKAKTKVRMIFFEPKRQQDRWADAVTS